MFGYVAAALVGALAMFFFDPERGAYRRNVTRNRFAGSVRESGEDLGRTRRRVASEDYGIRQKLAHQGEDAPLANDATLAQRVMSELFRDEEIPQGDINVDAVAGIVYLRGQIERPDLIEHIESRVRRIDGVRDVRNFLHQPGTLVRGRSLRS